MPLLDDFLTEAELVAELKAKTGKGSKRGLRDQRAKRTGPPWAKYGNLVIYPIPAFKEWLLAQIVRPVGAGR
jgi:hypothetical protein